MAFIQCCVQLFIMFKLHYASLDLGNSDIPCFEFKKHSQIAVSWKCEYWLKKRRALYYQTFRWESPR